MKFFLFSILAVLGSVEVFGQANSIVSAGYEAPAAITVAPGQVITFLVAGIGSSLTGPVRASTPVLPTSLAGISVTLRQGADTPVPLFEVRPLSSCSTAGVANPCVPLTEVTAQMPFEISLPCLACTNTLAINTQVVVSENGTSGIPVSVRAVPDDIHILTACDILISGGATPSSSGLPCAPMVTHADGSLVSASNPAKGGETLVAYAFGLGQTDPIALTGTPALAPLKTVGQFILDFNLHPNALPSKTGPITPPPFAASIFQPTPIFSGLVRGFVGLYQINFAIPQIPEGTPTCGTYAQSNLTVSMGSVSSFDGAGICVVP